MTDKAHLAEQHRLYDEVVFYLKSRILIALRLIKNWTIYRTQKFPIDERHRELPIISYSETDLWNRDDNGQNWILTAGKVHNLRIAIRKINGLEIPAGKTFSFWRHIGKPSKHRGYVVGREIREGCIVPTIAGGLCQLSNALYDAALKAGFEIIERHRHTRVVKGSLAEVDRDATVKWNYIDLRLRSPYAFRIEIEMDAEKLLVKFCSDATHGKKDERHSGRMQSAVVLNDCFSCGNFECFKHPDKGSGKTRQAVTTYLVDERWAEYEKFLMENAQSGDYLVVPFLTKSRFKIKRYAWNASKIQNTKSVSVAAVREGLRMRAAIHLKRNIFSAALMRDKALAQVMLKQIPVASNHLVVSQNLLPFLWMEGALGGRTFDVLMTRLPMQTLHERLDFAYKKFPGSATLNDFRAPDELLMAENAALTRARHIITPHTDIVSLFKHKSLLLDWIYPKINRHHAAGKKILFPASSLGRKGAYEMRQLARDLGFTIKILGRAIEEENFWTDVKVEYANKHVFADVQLVVYPAYVEHQPRFLLKAIAMGLPVVATGACGLRESEYISIVPAGDYEALKQKVMEKMGVENIMIET